MSQDDEVTRVKARIKALAERTVERGYTEAEAMPQPRWWSGCSSATR